MALLVAACGSSSSDDVAAETPEPATTTSVVAVEVEGEVELGDDDSGAESGEIDMAIKPVVVVPDGDPPTELVVEDLLVGDGPAPRSGDILVMHYVGVRHSDGGEFDSSWDRGSTFQFPLGAHRVIQGWDEGLVGMKQGGRRLLSIPPELAYDDRSPSDDIPPNSALVFVVDLIDIIAQPQVINAPAPVTELEVTVLEEGDGATLEAGMAAELHFVILLQPTGVPIDSTFTDGQTRTFTIGIDPTQSLAAWDEGLVGNQVGDLVRLVIPPELGFGDRGADVVGPNDTIITEVRIMSVR